MRIPHGNASKFHGVIHVKQMKSHGVHIAAQSKQPMHAFCSRIHELRSNRSKRASIEKINSRPCKNKYMTLDVKNLYCVDCAVVHVYIRYTYIQVVCVFKKNQVLFALRFVESLNIVMLGLFAATESDRYSCDAFTPTRLFQKESPTVNQPQNRSFDRSLLLGKYDGSNDVKRDYAPRSH